MKNSPIVRQLEICRRETQTQIDQIDQAIAALKRSTRKPKRILSADARARISKAQKKRWAAYNRSKAA